MAKLRATPKNYAEALAVLNGRGFMRLGNNTYLELLNGLQFIGVRLHNTYIVRFHENGTTTLHTGGYYTVTTKERINQLIAGRVFQTKGDWYYSLPIDYTATDAQPVRREFTEGMEV